MNFAPIIMRAPSRDSLNALPGGDSGALDFLGSVSQPSILAEDSTPTTQRYTVRVAGKIFEGSNVRELARLAVAARHFKK